MNKMNNSIQWFVIPGTPWVTELHIDRERPQPGLRPNSFIKLEGDFGRSRWEGRRGDYLVHGESYLTIKLSKEEAVLSGMPAVIFELDELNTSKIQRMILIGKKERFPGIQLRKLYKELGLEDKTKEIDGWGASWGAQVALKL